MEAYRWSSSLTGLLILFSVLSAVTTLGPRCLQCDKVESLGRCKNTVRCASTEQCVVNQMRSQTGFYYNVGCRSVARCSQIASLNVVGRRDTRGPNGDTTLCGDCCQGDFCNDRKLCHDTSKAEITKPLASLYKHRLDGATFHCEVAGTPTPSIRWLKDGVPLTGLPSMCRADQLACLHDNARTLELDDIDSGDNGNFTCIATNIYGSESSTAILEVDGPPVVWMSNWTTPRVGDKVQIECHVTGALRQHQLTWTKKLSSLPSGAQITDLNNLAGLTFDYTGPAESGLYRCMDGSSSNYANEVVGVIHDVGILNCSSTFDQCSHVAGALCGGTCPAHCGYNPRSEAALSKNTKICSHVSLEISFKGGQVLWEMQNSGDPRQTDVKAYLLSV